MLLLPMTELPIAAVEEMMMAVSMSSERNERSILGSGISYSCCCFKILGIFLNLSGCCLALYSHTGP